MLLLVNCYKFAVPNSVINAPKKARAVVVSIGVNASENPAYNLRYAVNDARKTLEIFGARLEAERGKYAEVVKIPIVSDYDKDKNISKNEAQKAIIKGVFALLAGKSFETVAAQVAKENPAAAEIFKKISNIEKLRAIEPEDALILTFSGHGYADNAGIFYLLPYDIGKATTALTTDALRKTISSDELSLWMQEITAAEMIFIIDACHSSAAVQGDNFKPGPMASRGLGQLAYDKDMKILSATQADNVALELGSLEQGLLSYALLQDGIIYALADAKQCEKVRTGWIILVTPDFRKAYPIDVRELNETVAALRLALRSDNYDPAPVAKKLYDKLFRQTSDKQKTTLEADLNEYFARTKATQKTLMWSLDGVLRYILTAVLHDGDSYLIEKYRSFVFTTASLTRLKDKNKAEWTIFGLGVSEARDGFDALPGVKRELLAIVRDGQLKNADAVVPGVIRLDRDFTRKAFLEGLREGYPVVHLASHFSYKNKQEDSFLLLGDSRLTLGEMRDFAPIFENVDLLTLSACNTATSDADNGKEVEGLGFVAQSLGAKAVIASLWEVSDTGTDELMKRFYKLRRDDPTLSKGEAFRQAQLVLLGAGEKEARKSSDVSRSEEIDMSGKKVSLAVYEKDKQRPFAHPHYWSAFVLIGNWR